MLAAVEQPERVEFFEIPPIPVSSTEVRERVAAGLPIDWLVPRGVEQLIVALGLYREPGVH